MAGVSQCFCGAVQANQNFPNTGLPGDMDPQPSLAQPTIKHPLWDDGVLLPTGSTEQLQQLTAVLSGREQPDNRVARLRVFTLPGEFQSVPV